MSGIGYSKKKGIQFALGLPYQFSTTTTSPVRVDNDGLIYYFGSAVRVPIIQKDSLGELKPKATGSTIQRPPEDNPNKWKFTLNPQNECGDTIIKNVYDTILFYQDGFVKAGSAPEQNYYAIPKNITVIQEGQPTQKIDRYQVKQSLFYQPINQGKIGFLGSKMPMAPSSIGSVRKDQRLLRKRTKDFPMAMPKTMANPTGTPYDYIQQSWITKAESQTWGSREMVIVFTTDGKFHSFPLGSPIGTDVLEENVIPTKYIKSISPVYPEWVFPFTNIKQETENRGGRLPLVPIISWSINREGTQAIACLVERKAFANNLFDQVLLESGSYPDYRSEQFDLGPAKVFADKTYFGDGDSEPLMIDRLGVVELGFTFEITGPELEEYSFAVDVISNEAPADTSPMRMAIAYAHPALHKKDIEPDSKIELFMQFFRTDDQLKFHRALDGLYGSETPQFGNWIIKVNGVERLKFPMQVFLDKSNPEQLMPFSCMKHFIESTTIVTELENLDLSSLSFYRTIRIRQPILERNKPRITEGAWLGKMNHLRKKCAIQTDAFVFGEIVETKQCGNPDLFVLFETYLNMNFTVNEWQPTVVHPLRANYRTFFTKPSTGSGFLGQGRIPPQWWGHVLFWPMWYVFAEMVHKEVAGRFVAGERHDWTYEQYMAYLNGKYDNDIPGTIIPGGVVIYENDNHLLGTPYETEGYHNGCTHGCSSAYKSLSQVTRANFEDYWYWVMNFNNGHTDISTIFGLTTIAIGGFGSHSYGSWPILSMLRTANPEWDGDSVVMSWLAQEIFILAKEIFEENFYYDITNVLNDANGFVFDSMRYNFSAYEYIIGLCAAYYHAADGQFSNSMDAFWMLDPGHSHTFEDHFVLRDYPWCWHFAIQNYNRLLVNRGRNKIMVHPNGHYSLMHDYLYCPTGIEPEAELWAYTLSSNATNHPDNPISDYRTGFQHTDIPATSPRDGFMMDKLVFWYDQHSTTHVDMHNQAFNRSESLTEYYPSGDKLYSYVSDEKEPIIVYGGQRYPSHRFNNPFLRFAMSEEANTLDKDVGVALAYPRVVPLWGK